MTTKMRIKSVIIFALSFTTVPLIITADPANDDDDNTEAGSNSEGDKDSDGEPNQEEVPYSFLRNTAKYGGACDMSLNDNYVLPIFQAKTVKELEKGRATLNEYLSKNPELESLSCYGFADQIHTDDDVYMSCQMCQDLNNVKKQIPCCHCHNAEPQVYERQLGHANPCKIKDSEFGDSCNFEVMMILNNAVYIPFSNTVASASKAKDVVDALQIFASSFAKIVETTVLGRLSCNSVYNNLECKDNNKCGCRYKPPYFRYTRHSDGKRCIAERGSICHIEVSVFRAGVLEYLAKCKNNVPCDDAIPNLTCDPILDKDCRLANEVITYNQTGPILYPLLKWNIRACGGVLKRYELNSGDSNCIRTFTFSLFLATSVVVKTTLGNSNDF